VVLVLVLVEFFIFNLQTNVDNVQLFSLHASVISLHATVKWAKSATPWKMKDLRGFLRFFGLTTADSIYVPGKLQMCQFP
jgi:hypothetical protein